MTILKALKEIDNISKVAYQYIIARLSKYPDDGIDISKPFIDKVRKIVKAFNRKADVKPEDFNKEILKLCTS